MWPLPAARRRVPGPQVPCRLPRPKRSCGAGALPSRSPAHQLSLEKARRNRMPRAKEDRILLAAARGKWRGRPRRVQSRAAAGFKCPAGPPAPAPQSQARSPRPLAPDRPRGPAQRKPTAHPPAEMPPLVLSCFARGWGPVAHRSFRGRRSPALPTHSPREPKAGSHTSQLYVTTRSVSRSCSCGAFLSGEVVAPTRTRN